tara:strand:+ start:21 stop:467 length:447 start_codon:yes stop_codon:yes gene_type:complete
MVGKKNSSPLEVSVLDESVLPPRVETGQFAEPMPSFSVRDLLPFANMPNALRQLYHHGDPSELPMEIAGMTPGGKGLIGLLNTLPLIVKKIPYKDLVKMLQKQYEPLYSNKATAQMRAETEALRIKNPKLADKMARNLELEKKQFIDK